MAARNSIPKLVAGNRFNMLVVLSQIDKKYWLCLCDCGTEKRVRKDHLTLGRVKSCGCKSAEWIAESRTVHGHAKRGSGTSIYSRWQGMLERCNNKNSQAYKRYGGRGITICDRWLSFENFYEDMGDPPDGMSLDRIDNDKGYSKDNCRWASKTEQIRNRSTSKILTFNGETKSIKEWADSYGIRYGTLQLRLRAGWSVDEAITTPVISRSNQFIARPHLWAKAMQAAY